MATSITINTEQKVKVTLNPKTLAGKQARVDGKPVWNVVAGNSGLEVAADGMSANLISSTNPGLTTFRVSADADLGEGISAIAEAIELTVVESPASSLGLTVGNAVSK